MAQDLIGTGTDHEVDPVSRIEGHLGVKVRVGAGNVIVDANAHGNLWRGFENFLLGRAANDAITFVQRICGVCPVPHGMTSTYAVDNVLGYSDGHITFKTAGTKGVPAKAVLIRNLVLASEFLMSSITHFYHLAAPSYVQGPAMPPWTPYFADSYYHVGLQSTTCGAGAVKNGAGEGLVPDAGATALVWDAVIISYVRALKIRRLTFEAGALFAGRMPMTSCYVGGGVTNDGTENLTARCTQFESIIREVGLFIINEYVPIALVLGYLYPDFDSNTPTIAGGAITGSTMKPSNRGYGAGLGRFLAWGAFPNLDANDTLTLPGGYYDVAATGDNWTAGNKAQIAASFLQATDPATGTYAGKKVSVATNLREDISNSRYDATAGYENANSAYPGAINRTKPNRGKAGAYTYMKAPRWAGKPCEVGPFARLAVAGIYPVNGTSLWAHPYMAAAADIYFDGGLLDANVIAPTIVTGLVNTGPLVGLDLVASTQNWILNLKGGLSTMDRLRARAVESLVLVQAMVGTVTKGAGSVLSFADDGWIHQLASYTGAGANANDTAASTWSDKSIPVGTVKGWGATEAPRGALMHHCSITNGKIVAYQCIVPTTWNGSPKDAAGQNGAIEAAMIGSVFNPTAANYSAAGSTGNNLNNVTGGVEVLRIAQSFDPCIACAVH